MYIGDNGPHAKFDARGKHGNKFNTRVGTTHMLQTHLYEGQENGDSTTITVNQ